MGCASSVPEESDFDPERRRDSKPVTRPPTVTFADENMTSVQNKMNLWSRKSSITRKTSMDGRSRLGSMIVRHPPVRVLLWMTQLDSRCKLLCRACSRLQIPYDVVYRVEAALEAYNSSHHQLVIIDQRNSKQVVGAPAFQLRSGRPNSSSVIVALVSKSFASKEGAVISLLQKGFSRWLVETANEGHCLNELQLLLQTDVANLVNMRATDALFTAINECRDIIEITDSDYNILFVNRTCVEALGLSAEEMYDHNLLRVHHLETTRPEQADQIVSQLSRGRQYDGHFTCRRRNGDSLLLPCRAFPVSTNDRSVDHLVFVKECPAFVLDRHPPISRIQNRASVRSLRKPSFDMRHSSNANQFVRRASLAKAPIGMEAPITKVIGILMAAQQSSPMFVSQELEKGLEILRSTELYSPAIASSGSKDYISCKPQDPVANDLLGALLSHGPSPSTEPSSTRRLSEGSTRLNRHSRPSLPSIQQNSSAIQKLLEFDLDWAFDVFKLERITAKRPLIWLGMHIFLRFDVPSALNIDIATLENWLNAIEANYHQQNSYHNSTHAADVLQCTAFFLERQRLKSVFDSVDEAICLIAATVHDVDHPGRSSQFMCNTKGGLALLYNDLSVLESHHSAFAFKLTHSDERVNIFKNLNDAQYKRVRQGVIDMVLATEMTKHFEHLSKFMNAFSGPNITAEVESAAAKSVDVDIEKLCTPDNMILIKRMLIKCADVSNPLRVRDQCVEWAHRIAEEYFSQTDAEKELGLPVVMPIFDRSTCSIPKSQIGFIDFFINDMFEAWDSLIDIPELIDNLEENYQYWCDLELAESRSCLETTAEESGSSTGSDRQNPDPDLPQQGQENGVSPESA